VVASAQLRRSALARLRTALVTSIAIAVSISGCCIQPTMVDVGPLDPLPTLRHVEVAHRGNITRPALPDNSLAALRASLQAGLEFLEVDVRRADDGVLFLFHDGSFSRSNSNAPSRLRGVPIAQISSAERNTVSLDDDRKETIPTLADALSLVQESSGTSSSATLQLDLKGESDTLVLAALELVQARGLLSRVLVQLRTPERVALALATYPHARILARCTSHEQLTQALKYPIEAVELERWISSEAIRETHARGVLVAVNIAGSRLDEPNTHAYFRSRGVDMIMTDIGRR